MSTFSFLQSGIIPAARHNERAHKNGKGQSAVEKRPTKKRFLHEKKKRPRKSRYRSGGNSRIKTFFPCGEICFALGSYFGKRWPFCLREIVFSRDRFRAPMAVFFFGQTGFPVPVFTADADGRLYSGSAYFPCFLDSFLTSFHPLRGLLKTD